MKEQKILFSIIVPVYNTAKYIDKCLESIHKAMGEDCEVIIINDGSTDNSEEKILHFLNRLDKDIKNNFSYIKKDNAGLADTKNVGIQRAKGEFISVVDSDDYISEDFYSIARNYINDYDIIIYDLYIIFENHKMTDYTARAYNDAKKEYKQALISAQMSGSSCNKIIRKTLYKNHEFPVGKQYEDTAVTPFILEEAEKIKYLPYAMYYYMQREKSIVATNTLSSAFYKICNNISDVLKDKDPKRYKNIINEFFIDRILEMLTEDLKNSNESFLKNVNVYGVQNKKIISYILENNLIYTLDNHYSERQKKLTKKILECVINEDYSKVKKILLERECINKFRRIIKH